MGIERELKLGVWPEFALPDLGRAIRGGSMGDPCERRLEAVYYDTRDLRLLRRGVTLRHRTGERDGGEWTIKLPGAVAAVGLERREVSLQAGPGAIPGLLADLARGWALGARLQQVARMETTRRSVAVLDKRGGQVATVDDDEVVVVRGRRVAARFRELEVELSADAPGDILARLGHPLREAGAQPVPQVPKLTHALGPDATDPWDLEAVPLPRRPTVRDVVAQRLVAAAGAIVDAHAALVLDEHPSAARAVRRLLVDVRADVACFGALLEAGAVARLERDITWFDGRLAAVTGLDGARALVARAAGEDGEALMAALDTARAAAGEDLRSTLRGARYRALLTSLVAVATDPPMTAKRRSRGWSASVARDLTRQAHAGLRPAIDGARADDGGATGAAVATRGLAVALAHVDAADVKAARRVARDVDTLDTALEALREARDAEETLHHAAISTGDTSLAYSAGLVVGTARGDAGERFDTVEAAAAKAERKSRWTWLA